MAGIIASDYWIVKRRKIDVPALCRYHCFESHGVTLTNTDDPHGRYRYFHGVNWQGLLAFLLAVGPNLPGLAYSINKGSHITEGAKHLYSFDWLYGFGESLFYSSGAV